MFGSLTEKMQGILSRLSGNKKITEDNISQTVSEVRLALLEADVQYGVVKTLIKRVKEKALGAEVVKSVSPGQQFTKIVHDQLAELMGGGESPLNLKGKPAVILFAGLQGSGKTTHCVKVAHYLQKNNQSRNPLLVACDLQRPGAVEQLKVNADKVGVSVFSIPGEQDPIAVAREALRQAEREKHDVLIVDTAGRLHIDEPLMAQLEQLKELLKPSEILFVANATIGQDAVNIASEFNKRIEITGTILSMLDGNTRGGAAIAIREVTGKPLKFEGIGERPEDLQPFNPSSMADRILGMGDTINLVRKAQEHINEEEAKELEQKLRKASFTYMDYLKQIQMVKKMGSFKSLLGMVPGMSALKGLDAIDDKQFSRVEAIIQSMTDKERCGKCELVPSRRRRIANGSGTKVDDVNRLTKTFKQARQFMKNMPNMKQLEKMMGGKALWR